MAESRAKRIGVVLTLVQRQEDTAAQRLGQFREQMQVEEQQLIQLREYSAQYLHDYAGKRSGVMAAQLINYSAFIGRLGDLVREQEVKLTRMQANLEKLQNQWRYCHQKRKSIEDLITRFKQEEMLELDKRLQKELDELSSRQHPPGE